MARHEIPPFIGGAEALRTAAWFCVIAIVLIGTAYGLLALIGGAG